MDKDETSTEDSVLCQQAARDGLEVWVHCCFCRAHPTPTRAPRQGCGSPNPDPHQFITVLGVQLCPQLCLPVPLEMGTQEWDEGWWLQAPTQFSPQLCKEVTGYINKVGY